jgi:ubiquinone/menaquinone biosynthesis C-methylase UbiE
MIRSISEKRWLIAQQYQHSYQQQKSLWIHGYENDIIHGRYIRAMRVSNLLSSFLTITDSTRILEVGSGPHGIGFFLKTGDRYGIDSLADFYHHKFSSLQVGSKVKTICGKGEQLPFHAETFNLIICDNVLDHTMNPELVIKEIQYVLKKNGILFLAVDVHHWLGYVISLIHEHLIGRWIILKWFGSHPFYFRYKDILQLLNRYGFRIAYKDSKPLSTKSNKPQSIFRWLKTGLWKFLFHTSCSQIVCINLK